MKASVVGLLNDLDCAFGALDFACSADKAFVSFHRHRFLVFDLVDSHWTSVNARATTSAFLVINNDLDHV